MVPLILNTKRLTLRPFNLEDAPQVAALADDHQIAAMTANIPHPYTLDHATGWISTHADLHQRGKALIYAIILKDTDKLIGVVSLMQLDSPQGGELGYWLGVPYWGKGFALEAAQGLITHACSHHGITSLNVSHLAGNERSKSVILKLGFRYVENRVNLLQGKPREVCVYKRLL
jgi:RimJ/RimL family protein N-acetyltransferase